MIRHDVEKNCNLMDVRATLSDVVLIMVFTCSRSATVWKLG